MKNADKRNIIAANNKPILTADGKSIPIFKPAKLKPAKVPGDEAFLMGIINLSNSLAI